MSKRWIAVLGLVPALALAGEGSGTVQGAQVDVVSRAAAMAAFRAAEDCHTRSSLARDVAAAKERDFDRARVIGMARDNDAIESMINAIYDADTLEQDFDTVIFQECLNESKRRLLE